MIVQAKGLTKRFGEGSAQVVAVDDVSLTIETGELVIVMGDSGCGKTTLISLLGCILTPDNGQLTLDGQVIDYAGQDLSQVRRQKIGFVFQLFNLIPYLSALENVIIAMQIAGFSRFEAEKRAKDLLTQVGLARRLDHRPAQLSGGEKQRVSFARALSNNPKIIFADEPTANLDSRQSDNLMNLVRQLRQEQQTTIVIVTHYQALQKDADRVIYMQDGKILTD
ncbi:MAG: ABC transporter ATP-binding protein [Candidatus Poribacteria bacterium]|nr:ABC transporter ATP-binding protein [Candidatus Poribacteria bacterium]